MSKIIVVIETRIELPNDDNPVISVKNDRLISITGKLTEEAKDILWENEDIDIDRLIKEKEGVEK
jgi:phosphoribosyl-ATP pyrophosphohydrolase